MPYVNKKIKEKQIYSNEKTDRFNQIFNKNELNKIRTSDLKATEILSFFATSLFDKNNTEDVLWSIVENCIAQLGLEDVVVYLWNKKSKRLVQKATFGNKQKEGRKVLSPITLKIGEGIVGHSAKNKSTELVQNLKTDTRYIKDDLERKSELAVPILFKGSLLGVLDSEHSKVNFFTNEHIFIFELIAKLTAVKLNQIQKGNQITLTNDNVYFSELQNLMREGKAYKEPTLSLSSVAQKLNVSGNYLSQLINKINQTNFTDYINALRVEEAKEMLKNPKYQNYTIVSIGIEAGFNSKSTFYTAFKKFTGKTPTHFKHTD